MDLLSYGLWRLLRPRAPEALAEPEEAVPSEVFGVVEASNRAHAVQVHLGDKQVLLSGSGRAFVMFAVEGPSWVTPWAIRRISTS